MDNSIPQPKIFNTERFRNNYEEIEWREKDTYCYECGKTFKKDEKREGFSDGHVRCIKCNFN